MGRGTAIEKFLGLWRALRAQGLLGWALGIVTSGMLAVVGWSWDRLPVSVIMLIALAAFALTSFIWHRISITMAVQKFDPANARALGQDLIDLARRSSATLAKFDLTANTEFERDGARERAAAFYEAHMAEVAAFVEVMKGLGVKLPFFVSSNRPDELITYLATVGALLKEGRLAEAQTLGQDDSGFEFASLTRRPQ